ncbi:MAG: DNA recombination protein RmuC [Candidatus Sungbacteria bacterium]|uniref:DNA recombination protein RmuC n=1 Tax=Candidatus Sungiibacteriota bacterium TaxID=2750080 RepID=A0A932QXQ4_9BACT|nr:DNA recombination protein RmuC [Candidatus Sungbacteria bacterium]
MSGGFLVVIGLLVAGFAGIFWFLRRAQAGPRDDAGLKNMFLMMQNQINEITRTLDARLSESNRTLQNQFGTSTRVMQDVADKSAKIVREVTEKLVKLDETNRQVVGFADQLKNLQDILKNPKQRGVLGEYYLETVLKNVLPPGSYQMQYAFSDGVIVDAAVFVDRRVIPVDSKFSLENYNRILEARDPLERKRYESVFVADLKLRIDETSKYVKPHENTMDFAFMFIPSEAVYYDLLINKVGAVSDDTKNLLYYAGQKKVIIVSPTSFLAYLQTVLQGLRNQKISEQAKEIVKQVENLNRHLSSYDAYFQKLGTHLGTTVSMYNHASKEFAKIDKDVFRITDQHTGAEHAALAQPETTD